MRFHQSALLCAAFLSVAASSPVRAEGSVHQTARAEFRGEVVVRVSPRSVADVRALEALSDDRWTCGPTNSDGTMDYRISRDRLSALDSTQIPYRIVVEDVQALIDLAEAEQYGPFENRAFFDAYPTYAQASAYVDSLVASYPQFATRISLGNSIQNRSIFALRLTSPVPPRGSSTRKPVVLINSIQHAREWISLTSTLFVATELLSGYATDPIDRRILDEYEVVVVPIVNPDGYNITWTSNRLWRKNARVISGSIRGVDLNRNWATGWGLSSGSSGSTTSDTYRGPSPFSEPESAALSGYINSIPKLVAHIDYHSFSQLILRPWGYQFANPPGRPWLDRIGNAMRSSILSATGASYTYGGSDILYLASGVAPDWTFSTTGAFAVTVELRDTGTNGFILPTSAIVPTGNDAYAAFTAMVTNLCLSDLNRDNVVDNGDFVLFADAYATFVSAAGDVTGDGLTDNDDFVLFSDAYNQFTCP